MTDVDIVRALRQFNTHWEGGEVSDLIRRSPHRRRSFQHLRKRIEDLPFEVLAGPRQVGKTTLMGHLMADLIASGVPRERVAYVPLDFPALALETDGRLAPIVEAYERFVLKEEIAQTREKVFLFLDEIQSLPNWGQELKGLYDSLHPHLRVLATGSSSAALLNPPSADFPGRVERSHIHPLKFGEVVQNALPATSALHDEARALRTLLATVPPSGERRSAVAKALAKFYASANAHEADIRRLLDVYLVRGGYPAAQPPGTDQDAFRFFEATLDTVLSKDLKLYEKVRKPGMFRAFLAKFAKEHSNKFVSASYAKDLGVDKEIPPVWKAIAEELFLVHQLPALNDSLHVLPGKADKAYVQDAGIRSYLTASARLEDIEESGLVGAVAEGILFDHLRRIQFNTHGHRNAPIGYLEKPEVDFLVELPKTWLAIECKYRNTADGAHRLKEHFGDGKRAIPILVTRNAFDVGGDVWQIPLWLFLLLA